MQVGLALRTGFKKKSSASILEGEIKMNKSSARSAITRTFVFLFVLVAAAGAQTYSVLTSFDGTKSNTPDAAPIIDNMGNVFGTTFYGGTANCGAVYGLVNNGGGSYTNNTLYSFACGYDGFNPNDS
jgi:hypothetical protein